MVQHLEIDSRDMTSSVAVYLRLSKCMYHVYTSEATHSNRLRVRQNATGDVQNTLTSMTFSPQFHIEKKYVYKNEISTVRPTLSLGAFSFQTVFLGLHFKRNILAFQ